jgi:predicted anti-sigma-YlaC factor YlaD
MRSTQLTCREVVELVSDYLEGTLTGRDRRKVEKHLAGCDGCTAFLHQMKETIRLTGRITEDRVPEPVRQELVAAFRDWRAG